MDWGQAMRMLQSSRVIRAQMALGEMIAGRSTRHSPLAAIQYGLFGLDFVSPFMMTDSGDDDDDDDDDYFEEEELFQEEPQKLVPHPRIKQLTPEEAENHAKELLKEEKRTKEKAEKRKLKRRRKKDRKQLEKLNAAKANDLPDGEEQGQSMSSENQEENININYIRETNEPIDGDPDPSQTKTEVTSPEERNGSNALRKKGELTRESEELDMNSCLVSTAANVDKKQLEKKSKPERNEKKKSDHHDALQPEEEDKPEVQEPKQDGEEQGQSMSSENQEENININYIRETNEPIDGDPDPSQTKTEVTSPEERNGSNAVRKKGELTRESEELDMNSCLVSIAATVDKKQLEKKSKPERNEKKKNHHHHHHHDALQPEEEDKPEVQEPKQVGEKQGQSTSSENQEENINIHYIRGEPDPSQSKTNVTSPQERNCSNAVRKKEALTRESEELDMNSHSVSTGTTPSTAATTAKKQLKKKPKTERKEKKKNHHHHHHHDVLQPEEEDKPEVQEPKQEKMSNEDVEEMVKRSTELANIGNQYAACGQLDVAVKYFTDAIKHNPTEYKLFGNRSFCYEKMQQYERALVDADLALSMEPDWVKGLFRKGKALCGLKRYYEASITYKEVLKRDSSRADASQELMRVHILQLMEMGFTCEQSLEALRAHSTFEEAVEALSSGIEVSAGASASNDTLHPTEEEWVKVIPPPRSQSTTKIKAPVQPVAKPLRSDLFPVWVGSLVPAITKSMLHSLFSKAGEVHSIKVLLEQQCAFVHYTTLEACETAILLLNGWEVEGSCLAVRHPNRFNRKLGASTPAVPEAPFVDPPAKVKKTRDECYFWRTSGCSKKDCSYVHIPQHKGINKDKITQQ